MTHVLASLAQSSNMHLARVKCSIGWLNVPMGILPTELQMSIALTAWVNAPLVISLTVYTSECPTSSAGTITEGASLSFNDRHSLLP